MIGEIVNADVKARTLRETCAQLGIEPTRAIAMGDGSNDLKMMAEAGLSVAFRAKPVVREAASVAFNYVGLDGLLRLVLSWLSCPSSALASDARTAAFASAHESGLTAALGVRLDHTASIAASIRREFASACSISARKSASSSRPI